jgi:hypothetical protein
MKHALAWFALGVLGICSTAFSAGQPGHGARSPRTTAASTLAARFFTPAELPIFPYRGMYYEAGRAGTGLSLDIDNKGFIFAMFYAYTPDGQPDFYIMTGNYAPRTDEERLGSGILGTFEATPLVAAGGECVGAGCAYKPHTETPTDLHAKIVWTAPRVATLTIDSQTWHLRAAQYLISDADALEGQWFFNAVIVTPEGHGPLSSWGSFTLQKTRRNVTAADFSQLAFVSPGSVVYDMTWKRIPLYRLKNGGDYFALYNPDTGRVDIVQAIVQSTGAIDATSVRPWGVAFPEGPQMMRGRYENAFTGGDYRNESDFSVDDDFTLVRSYPVSIFVNQSGNAESN